MESDRVISGRLIGVVYLLYFATAIGGELVLEQAGVSGFGVTSDADVFANKLMAHQAAFQAGFAISLVSIALYVAVTALFYVLLRPVDRTVALVATFMSLIGQAVAAVASLLQLAPLAILGGSQYLAVFSPKQLHALALLFINVNGEAGSIALLFDGLFLILIGYLVYRSTFLPRVIGVLLAAAGLAWLTFLAPPLAQALAGPIEVLGVVAEASLMLWLLVRGVDHRRWLERARSVA